MVNNRKIDWKAVGTIFTVILAVLAFLFGNDIMGKISGPNIALNSTIEDFPIPEKLMVLINANEDELPNSIRFISIKNVGSKPSRNNIIRIDVEGEIFQFKANSPETINEISSSNNNLSIVLDRLSSNADLNIVIWLKNENKQFKTTYSDDIKSMILENKSQSGESSNLFISAVSLAVALGALTSYLFDKIRLIVTNQEQKSIEVSNEVKDILLNFDNIAQQNEDIVNREYFRVNDAKGDYSKKMKEIIKLSKEISKS